MLTELETGLSFLPDNEKFDKTLILKIDIDDIIPNDKNVLSTDDIDELAESIHKDGLLNPLKVYKNEDGTYELFGGHRRYLALKKLVDEDDDFDPEVSCIVYKRPADELRERLQIIQDNAQRDMTQEDRKKLFIELNNIFDTAEAEGNHAIGDGRSKSDWIAIKLGVSQRTVRRWIASLEGKKEVPAEEKPDEKNEDKPSKPATPANPDAPDKEDIAQAKDILSSKFASVNVTKGKITFKFETKDDLAELVEMLTGTEMVV